MRIAISCQEDTIESLIDQRFGRSRYFMIVDIEQGEIKDSRSVINEGSEQGHGAGIKAAEQLGKLKVDCLLTGQLGPNATSIIGKLGIKAYGASGKASEAVVGFMRGELPMISETSSPHSDSIPKVSQERIFFPLLDNRREESEISQHFGHAPYFGVYDVQAGKLSIIGNDLDHTDPSKSPIDQIVEAVHPTTIYAKGIGGRAIQLIAQKGMALKTGDHRTVGDALKDLGNLRDQIESCGHVH